MINGGKQMTQKLKRLVVVSVSVPPLCALLVGLIAWQVFEDRWTKKEDYLWDKSNKA